MQHFQIYWDAQDPNNPGWAYASTCNGESRDSGPIDGRAADAVAAICAGRALHANRQALRDEIGYDAGDQVVIKFTDGEIDISHLLMPPPEPKEEDEPIKARHEAHASNETGDEHVTYYAYAPGTPYRKILELHGIKTENRSTWHEGEETTERTHRAGQYRGSGLWSRLLRSKGAPRAMEVSVDVGCHCEHDCCGHVCGWRMVIMDTPHCRLAIVTVSYNL